MEKQMEQLAALLVRQADMAKQAQEVSQRREERLSHLLEQAVTGQPSGQGMPTATGADANDATQRHVRFPASAAVVRVPPGVRRLATQVRWLRDADESYFLAHIAAEGCACICARRRVGANTPLRDQRG